MNTTTDNSSEQIDKDLLEIQRLQAVSNINTYQEETSKWRNQKIRTKNIKSGDFVLKRNIAPNSAGKLQEKWEGPYIARASGAPGAFYLLNQDGEQLKHSWNEVNLRKFFL